MAAVWLRDTICFSGGGVRATTAGLVFLSELEQRANPLRARPVDREASAELRQWLPPRDTYGLSGGAWCVLANEVVGPSRALFNMYEWIMDPQEPRGIGYSFGLWNTVFKTDKTTFKDWQGYVDEVIEALVTPLEEARNFANGVRARRIESTLKQARTCNVLIGVSEGAIGWKQGCISLTSTTATAKMDNTPPHDYRIEQPEDLNMSIYNRRTQAIYSSTAFLFEHNFYRTLSTTGLPFSLFSPVELCMLWDLGIRANVSVTYEQLHTAGVSLVVDASMDKHLFDSMNDSIAFWQKKYEVTVESVSHLYGLPPKKHESADAAAAPQQIVWKERPLTFETIARDPELQKYVGVYRVTSGGSPQRTIVVIQLGRMLEDGSMVPENDRLRGIETTEWTFKYGVIPDRTAKLIWEPQFKILNDEVRCFYRRVLQELGLPHGHD